MYPATTVTKFGRYQVSDPFRPDRLHFHDGSQLREVDHEPPVPVLDQEDLLTQGIDTATLIPGAQQVDALGSCTCNAGTVSLAERVVTARGGPAATALSEIRIGATTARTGVMAGLSTTDAVANEEFAILLYHLTTDQTGDPAQEWPSTDCGSTGLYVCMELERQGLITGHKTASGVTSVVSLMQAGTVIMGSPFFNAWMQPDALGFADGDGSMASLMQAVNSGVAGGHETCLTAVEQLTFDALGRIDPGKSHVRIRNSWGSSWSDSGSFRLHLSTLEMLGTYCDFKQMVA